MVATWQLKGGSLLIHVPRGTTRHARDQRCRPRGCALDAEAEGSADSRTASRRLGVSRAVARTEVIAPDRDVAVEIHLSAAGRRDEWISSAPPSGSVQGRRRSVTEQPINRPLHQIVLDLAAAVLLH